MTIGGAWRAGQSCAPNPCSASLVATCAADFDLSGRVDVQDVLVFLDAWLAFDPRSDVNASGEIGVADVFDFLTVWLAGC
jgi:hypothetical protein